MMTNDHYFDEMMRTFPPLQSEILAWDAGMIHFRMDTFAVYTIEQIKPPPTPPEGGELPS